MATGGGRQLTLFQGCISDSHDIDDDTGTKCARLSPGTSTAGTDKDQSSNADADSELPEPGIFPPSQMNLRRVRAIFLVSTLTILHLKTLLGRLL